MEEILYGVSPYGQGSAHTTYFMIENVTQGAVDVSGGSAVLNSTFGYTLENGACGTVTGTVSLQDDYTYSTGEQSWLISHETWNVLNVTEQCPQMVSGF